MDWWASRWKPSMPTRPFQISPNQTKPEIQHGLNLTKKEKYSHGSGTSSNCRRWWLSDWKDEVRFEFKFEWGSRSRSSEVQVWVSERIKWGWGPRWSEGQEERSWVASHFGSPLGPSKLVLTWPCRPWKSSWRLSNWPDTHRIFFISVNIRSF